MKIVLDLNTPLPARWVSRPACTTQSERRRSSGPGSIARPCRRPLPAHESASPIECDGNAAMCVEGEVETLQAFHAACVAVLRGRAGPGGGRALEEFSDALLFELGALLAPIVGVEGYRALLARALRLAAVEFPLLAHVRPAPAPPGRLLGVYKLARTAPADAHQALASALTQVVWLLLSFIGPDVTLSLLREVWPWALTPPER